MLFVPYSWIRFTRFCRRPVRIDAIAMTVETPMTIPSTVSALRNLCTRMLSSDIETISLELIVAVFMPGYSVLRQCNDGVESRGPECGVDAGHHADAAGNDEGQDDIRQSNCH